MRNKILQNFDAAVADIPDGATIMFAEFGGIGSPQNLIAALNRQGATNLTGISNNHGGTDGRVDVGTLVEAGQIKKMICAFTAPTHPSQVTPFARLFNNGEIEGELVPQGTLAERVRAGGAGIAAFYTPTGVGTLLAKGKELRVIDGKEYVLETGIKADYALLRAHKADTLGNLIYKGTSRNFNASMAPAATVTVVEVDEIVEPGDLNPEEIVTPGIFVQRIVQRPSDFSPYD